VRKMSKENLESQKAVKIKGNVIEQLDRLIKEAYEEDDEELTYNDVIRRALKKAEMWKKSKKQKEEE